MTRARLVRRFLWRTVPPLAAVVVILWQRAWELRHEWPEADG